MKNIRKHWLIILSGLFLSCNNTATETQTLINKTDSLTASIQEIKDTYRPGLGEIMGGIQVHHAKLWYACINNNWGLAAYEIAEIKERFQQAATIEADRPEVKMIPMIYPSIDSVANAIDHKNLVSFKTNFQTLTNTCNGCHTANHFEFNVITIPTAPPVSNQDFKAK